MKIVTITLLAAASTAAALPSQKRDASQCLETSKQLEEFIDSYRYPFPDSPSETRFNPLWNKIVTDASHFHEDCVQLMQLEQGASDACQQMESDMSRAAGGVKKSG